MKRKTISINLNGDETPTEIVLRTALVGDGLMRGDLIAQAFESFKDQEPDKYTKTAAIVLMPSCLACVESPTSLREMTVEDYMKIEDSQANIWLAAAYELNPQWDPNRPQPDPQEAEKKSGT